MCVDSLARDNSLNLLDAYAVSDAAGVMMNFALQRDWILGISGTDEDILVFDSRLKSILQQSLSVICGTASLSGCEFAVSQCRVNDFIDQLIFVDCVVDWLMRRVVIILVGQGAALCERYVGDDAFNIVTCWSSE